MKTLKNEIKKNSLAKINEALPSVTNLDALPLPKKAPILPIVFISSGILTASIAIALPIALYNRSNASSNNLEQVLVEQLPATSLNSENSIDFGGPVFVPLEELHKPYDKYAFDEYYCEAENSYIRLYENGYFRYVSETQKIVQPYSTDGSLIIVYNNYIDGDPEDIASHKVDSMIFNINNDVIVSNSDFSAYNSTFSLNNKSFVLSRKEVADNAKCRYSKSAANNLIVSHSAKETIDDVDAYLSNAGLSSYKEYVSSSYQNNIKFTFPLSEINTINVISTFVGLNNNGSTKSSSIRFDDSAIIRTANIAAFELTAENIVSNYELKQEITISSSTMPKEDFNKGLCFETYQDAMDYANNIRPIKPSSTENKNVIEFIESLNQEDFANKKLIVSNVVLAEDTTFDYDFKNMYLKEGELIIVLEKTHDPYAYGFQKLTYSVFAFMVDKNISFDSIVTLF